MRNSVVKKKGFSLIEIILAVSLFALFSVGIFALSFDSLDRSAVVQNDSLALYYAQQGLEAARSMRDSNYLSLTNGDHGLSNSGGVWSFVVAPEIVDGFYERTIIVEDVYRNASGDIDDAGAVFDPDIKKVVSEVVWNRGGILDRTVTLTSYLSNWRGDDWIVTTCSEFDLGTYDQTVKETAVSPPPDNCDIELQLEESVGSVLASADLGVHATDVHVNGNYAYVSKNDTNEGFAVVDVSNPASPVELAGVDVGQKGRGVIYSNGVAYLGVQDNSDGLAVVNVSNPNSPSLLTSVNIGDYGNRHGVSGNYLYAAVDEDDDNFRSYDVSNPGSPQLLDVLELNDKVLFVEVVGNYAYVGTSEDEEGLVIVDISNPSDLSVVSTLDTGEEVNAVVVLGPVAYLGTEESDDSLKVVDVSNPASPSVEASLNVGGEIVDLVASDGYLYAAVDEVHAGFAAINIASPFAPSLAYTLDVTGKGTGVDADYDSIYVTTTTSNKGLVILSKGQAAVATSGEYVSNKIDTGSYTTEYKMIEWDYTEVPGGSLSFQVRTADSAAGLDSADWVGSDGTSATSYTLSRTPIEVSPSASGTRYIQFRAVMTSDGVSTPLLHSVRINYIP